MYVEFESGRRSAKTRSATRRVAPALLATRSAAARPSRLRAAGSSINSGRIRPVQLAGVADLAPRAGRGEVFSNHREVFHVGPHYHGLAVARGFNRILPAGLGEAFPDKIKSAAA